MSYQTLTLEICDGLATLTLDRPERANSIDVVTAADLRRAAIALGHDERVRAVLLRAGGKVFCGGGDLKVFAELSSEELPAYLDDVTIDLHAAFARLAKLDAPVVAAVTGSVGGGGMSLVAACDLVVAARSAKFTMGYTKAGLVPDGTSSFFLARVVGLRRAMELVLTNRVLTADEAADWGLVNRVVPDDEAEATARELAEQLAVGPTRAFGSAKRLLLEGANSSLEAAMERESAAMSTIIKTGDAVEGITGFLEKRAPTFKGH